MPKLTISLVLPVLVLSLAPLFAAETEAAKKDLAQLQGEWSMVSAGGGGQTMPSASIKNSKRVCKGDETTVTVAGQLLMKAKFTLDPSSKPKGIDYQVIGGPNTGKSQLGIYELDGDTVKFCFGAPGKPRPTDFSTSPGDGRTSSVWKRDKK
jgi:uncharacterized protein (TIGR03067 family)